MNVDAVWPFRRQALLSDGHVIPITTFLNRCREETDDPDEAVFAVGPLPDGKGWVTIDMRGFEADAE